jgi:hypothetical protein
MPLLRELARWQHTITERLALTLTTPIKATEAEKLVDDHALTNVLLDEQSIVRRRSWGDREFGGPPDAGGRANVNLKQLRLRLSTARLHLVPAGH